MVGLEYRLFRHESNTVTTVFEEDQQAKPTTTRNEEPLVKNVIRFVRTESTRITEYERFQDQEIDVDGKLIEEAMIMNESEPVELDQDINDLNCYQPCKKNSGLMWTGSTRLNEGQMVKLQSIRQELWWEVFEKTWN